MTLQVEETRRNELGLLALIKSVCEYHGSAMDTEQIDHELTWRWHRRSASIFDSVLNVTEEQEVTKLGALGGDTVCRLHAEVAVHHDRQVVHVLWGHGVNVGDGLRELRARVFSACSDKDGVVHDSGASTLWQWQSSAEHVAHLEVSVQLLTGFVRVDRLVLRLELLVPCSAQSVLNRAHLGPQGGDLVRETGDLVLERGQRCRHGRTQPRGSSTRRCLRNGAELAGDLLVDDHVSASSCLVHFCYRDSWGFFASLALHERHEKRVVVQRISSCDRLGGAALKMRLRSGIAEEVRRGRWRKALYACCLF